jgi:tetratricopeptide (TPR) repeat protein/transglutaminase-like putative cysteine protease
LRYKCTLPLLAIIMASPSFVQAGEVPLYEPAPAWVVPATLPDTAMLSADSPAAVLVDMQQRIEDGRTWSYVDVATRAASPEMLSRLATLTAPWAPDKGDLIVHELAILRGGQRIDLIAQGRKFTVLRREQALEQRELTGILTATLAIEGLQVGDILRVRVTTTLKDAALGGRAQSIAGLIAEPAPVGPSRLRLSWPTASAPHWKILADGVVATPTRKGAYTELALTMPISKQPEMPQDAPQRYLHPPLVEVSTFADWADVSKVMAPLYATEGTIAPGSPIAIEVAAIMKAEATPLGQAERALELVQDKIRYLAIGMDGGNYVPQTPTRTWEVRYGDCKAKTLLLLAMLHEMKVDAEPVLASVGLGDIVPNRLPSAGAFNHVLVRATIAGETLWLDGTGSGARIGDIGNTPPFRHVLPLRESGAALIPIVMHADVRPMIDVSIDADESASVDIPSVFEATAVIRGQPATMMTLARSQLGQKQQREAVSQFFQGVVGQAQFSSATITPDSTAGTVTLAAHGVVTTPWFTEERKLKRNFARAFDRIEFSPDRGRPAWTTIPVVTADPSGVRYRLRVRLPDRGVGYAIDGEQDLKARLAGYDVARTTRLADGFLTVDEQIDAIGGEIPAAQVAGERDKMATAKARVPRLVASEKALRRWDMSGRDPVGSTQIKAVDAAFGQAIALSPEEVSGYTSRASFRAGIGDRRGAMADLARAIVLEPTVDLYLQRAAMHYELGDLAASAIDAEAARQLDPSSAEAIGRIAWLKAEGGDLVGAAALLDERIALGGDTRATYRNAKATAIGEFGDPAEAIKLIDAMIAEKPGSPSLMNARCWVKGTRSVMLDTALKDCTDAIELSSNTTASLDSRALIWYRLGRYEEALRDLDVILASAPGLAPSRYMRGVVLTRLHRDADAAKDFAVARRLTPSVDKTYARYGIKP